VAWVIDLPEMGKSVYLAGAIEYAPDGGCSWRIAMSQFLKQKLGLYVFDPSSRERQLLTENEKKNFRTWKSTDRLSFLPVIHRIIDNDLEQLTQKTLFVIVLWDKYCTQGTGTAGELTMAYHYKIPVYMVLDIPKESTSSWALGCATEVFESFKDLERFLINKYQ